MSDDTQQVEATEPVETLKQLQAELVELGMPAEAVEGIKTRTSVLATINALKSAKEKSASEVKKVASLEEKPNPTEEKEIVRQYKAKSEVMRQKLEKQPKVRFFLPISEQEKPGVVREIIKNGRKEQLYISGAVETVQLNGYKILIPKGVYVDVPQQVADHLSESMHLTQNAGASLLIDRIDPTTGQAVSSRLE